MILEALANYIFDRKFLYQSIVTLVLILTIKVARHYQIRIRRFRLYEHYGIPGPKPRLFDGNLRDFRTGEVPFRVQESFRKKYGKIYGFFIGDEPSMVITDLEILKAIFLNDTSDCFTERSRLLIKNVMAHGILFAKYPRWKLMRRVMSPLFSSYTIRGESSTQFVENSVKRMINYIEAKEKSAKTIGGKFSIDMHSLMKSTALNLISTMALKMPDIQVKENEEYSMKLDKYLAMSGKDIASLALFFPYFQPIFQLMSNRSGRSQTIVDIRNRISKFIDNYYDNSTGNGYNEKDQLQVIDLLVKLYHERKLSKIEVLGNVEALLFAGYDTTSTTLTYVFWALAKHPRVQEQLRSELLAHGTQSKYLEQVINETMRLYPTVVSFTLRLATKTAVIKNLIIPQGTRVIYNSWLINHDPVLWPDPDKFDPTRFQDVSRIHPCAFAPFGLGEKKCIGYQLAMLEMKMVVCDVLLRYKLTLKSPENLELVSCAFILTKPKEKVVLELERV